MCPLLESTNRRLPPNSRALWYALSHGTMWSLRPATKYVSMIDRSRSTARPSTSSAPACANELSSPMWMKSRCSPAASRTVSWFQ